MPIEILQYKCPYCDDYVSSSSEKVIEHIMTCKSNDTLPKCDCFRCKNYYTVSTLQRVGHNRGYQPLSKVVIPCCKVLKIKRTYGEYCHKFEKIEV